MKNIKLILLESNLFVSLGVWSLVKLTGLTNSIEVNDFALFSLISTICVYSFCALLPKIKSEGVKSLFVGITFQKVLFVCSLALLPYFILEFEAIVIIVLIPIFFIAFLYSIKLISYKNKNIALREIPYIKIFLIGVSWSVVTVVLPILSTEIQVNILAVFLEAFVRMLFVVAITIPFDIRDVNIDSLAMKTIPQKLGIIHSRNIAILLLAITSIYYIFRNDINVINSTAIISFFIISALLVYKAITINSRMYYSVVLEGISILLYISVYFSRYYYR